MCRVKRIKRAWFAFSCSVLCRRLRLCVVPLGVICCDWWGCWVVASCAWLGSGGLTTGGLAGGLAGGLVCDGGGLACGGSDGGLCCGVWDGGLSCGSTVGGGLCSGPLGCGGSDGVGVGACWLDDDARSATGVPNCWWGLGLLKFWAAAVATCRSLTALVGSFVARASDFALLSGCSCLMCGWAVPAPASWLLFTLGAAKDLAAVSFCGAVLSASLPTWDGVGTACSGGFACVLLLGAGGASPGGACSAVVWSSAAVWDFNFSDGWPFDALFLPKRFLTLRGCDTLGFDASWFDFDWFLRILSGGVKIAWVSSSIASNSSAE